MKILQLNIFIFNIIIRALLVAQSMKNLPVMQETWVQSLGWEDPLGKEIETHSSILVWEIPWTEPCGLQSTESQRVRHIQATKPPLPHHDENNMSMKSIPKQCIFESNIPKEEKFY